MFMIFMMLFYEFNCASKSTWLASYNLHRYKLNRFDPCFHFCPWFKDNKSPCISRSKTKQIIVLFYQTFIKKIKFHNINNIDLGLGYKTKRCKPTSGYRTKTMYVYYIPMKIYILIYTISFHLSIFLCGIIMSHHSFTMDFT
jgi:hypothetical protein